MLPSKTFKGCKSFDMLTTLFLSFLPRFMLCCSSLLLHDAAVLLLQLYICYCLSLCMSLSLSISLAGFHCLVYCCSCCFIDELQLFSQQQHLSFFNLAYVSLFWSLARTPLLFIYVWGFSGWLSPLHFPVSLCCIFTSIGFGAETE